MTKEAKRLKNFLRKHGCLNKFRRNLSRIPESAGSGYLNIDPSPKICDAFTWDWSPERNEYWEKLDDMYRKSKQQDCHGPFNVHGLRWAEKCEPVRDGWKFTRVMKP